MPFEAFIKAPEAHATVVLVASGLDRRRAIVKTLFKRATVIDFGGLADTGDAQRWVRTEQKRRGVTIEPDAIRLLVARAGTDISRLRADFERVVLYATGQSTVCRSDVEAVVARPCHRMIGRSLELSSRGRRTQRCASWRWPSPRAPCR